VSDIFREIDEELRRDNLLKVWKRYGTYIIGVAALIVAATGGYVAWQKYEEGRRFDQSRAYQGALSLAQSDPKAAAEAMEKLGGGGAPYGMLARFQEGALKARQGDTAGALATYDALSKDSGISQVFRDAATILYATQALDTADPKALIERLTPLSAPTSAWRHSALELTGLAAQRAGDTARARDIFTALKDDTEAPAGVRGRAAEILAALQG
jgi:hypothetical protein